MPRKQKFWIVIGIMTMIVSITNIIIGTREIRDYVRGERYMVKD